MTKENFLMLRCYLTYFLFHSNDVFESGSRDGIERIETGMNVFIDHVTSCFRKKLQITMK